MVYILVEFYKTGTDFLVDDPEDPTNRFKSNLEIGNHEKKSKKRKNSESSAEVCKSEIISPSISMPRNRENSESNFTKDDYQGFKKKHKKHKNEDKTDDNSLMDIIKTPRDSFESSFEMGKHKKKRKNSESSLEVCKTEIISPTISTSGDPRNIENKSEPNLTKEGHAVFKKKHKKNKNEDKADTDNSLLDKSSRNSFESSSEMEKHKKKRKNSELSLDLSNISTSEEPRNPESKSESNLEEGKQKNKCKKRKTSESSVICKSEIISPNISVSEERRNSECKSESNLEGGKQKKSKNRKTSESIDICKSEMISPNNSMSENLRNIEKSPESNVLNGHQVFKKKNKKHQSEKPLVEFFKDNNSLVNIDNTKTSKESCKTPETEKYKKNKKSTKSPKSKKSSTIDNLENTEIRIFDTAKEISENNSKSELEMKRNSTNCETERKKDNYEQEPTFWKLRTLLSESDCNRDQQEAGKSNMYLKDELEEAKDRCKLSDEQRHRLKHLFVILPWPPHQIHLIETRVAVRPTEQQRQQIEASNVKVKTGIYSKTEDAIIKKNWKKFCKVILLRHFLFFFNLLL